MTINSNIIFTIGSKLGPGGFASLKAGIDMLVGMAKTVMELTEELDKSAQAWNRTNKQAVLMADTAAAGLIDTNAIVKQYNVLMQAGVKITDEQFRTLAARSVELAQATGQDATQAFERLTNAIRSGSTEAFREYGVNLKQSTKLSDTHKNAIEAMTKGHENLSASAETTTERLTALQNNIGTTIGLLWDAGSNETLAFALDEVNTSLATFNEMLAEAPRAMDDFIESGRAMDGFIAEMKARIVELSVMPIELLRPGLEMLKALGIAPAGTLLQGFDTLIKQAELKQRELAEISRGALEEYRRAADAEEAPVPAGFRPRAVTEAGGEAEGPDFQQQFLEEDLEMRRQIEERIIADHEMRQEILAAEEEAEMLALQNSSQRQEEYFLYLDELEEQAHWRKLTRFETMMGVEQQYIAASSKQWASGLQGKAQMMGMFFGSVAQLMDTESEKMFKIGKAAAIAEAVVNTYLGAIKAYQAMAGIPYVGPALGAAAAAAVVAAGVAAISNISRQQFRGGESGTGAAATASRISSNIGSTPGRGATNIPSGATPSGATAQTQGEQKLTVNIVMRDGGAGLFDVVMDQNDSAGKDGRRYFATTGV